MLPEDVKAFLREEELHEKAKREIRDKKKNWRDKLWALEKTKLLSTVPDKTLYSRQSKSLLPPSLLARLRGCEFEKRQTADSMDLDEPSPLEFTSIQELLHMSMAGSEFALQMSQRQNFVHKSFAFNHVRRADILYGEGWLKGFEYAFQDEKTF